MAPQISHGQGQLLGMHEERQGLRNTPGQGIGRAQARGGLRKPETKLQSFAESDRRLEDHDSPAKFPLDEVKDTETETRNDAAVGVIDRLGNPKAFIPYGHALGELS